MNLKQSTTLDIHHRLKIIEFAKDDKKILKLSKKKSTKKTKAKAVMNKINNLEKKKLDYYLLVMDILIQYYDVSKPVNTNALEVVNKHQGKTLNDFVNKKNMKEKETLYKEYMWRLHKNKTSFGMNNNRKKKSICKDCNINMSVDLFTSIYICKKCGSISKYFTETDKIPYVNEALIEGNHFSYRRYDHFVDWLSKFQKDKKSKIPKSIIDLVKNELDKIKNKDDRNINNETILQILKKTGNTKYNNLIHEIINRITNKPVPRLPVSIQEKMKIMFKKTQKPFENVCPKTRTNFLSYSYVIRKFLEILNQYQYIEYFPLLKSREKLYSQDMIWKSMCHQLNWKYNPSI